MPCAPNALVAQPVFPHPIGRNQGYVIHSFTASGRTYPINYVHPFRHTFQEHHPEASYINAYRFVDGFT